MIQHLNGDCREVLKTLANESVHCCITSPPYWGLRDYGNEDQIGLERTPQEYVKNMVDVFHEVRRVLRDDGTLWLNIGDTYNGNKVGNTCGKNLNVNSTAFKKSSAPGLKPKDLIGIPWRVAFALQEDGWYLRSDIIWQKPNCLPESVKDRPTKSHEYIFLLSKSRDYFYDAAAIREPYTDETWMRMQKQKEGGQQFINGVKSNISSKYENDDYGGGGTSFRGHKGYVKADGSLIGDGYRNKRSVWSIPTAGLTDAHFAVYPPDLIRPCIIAGSPMGGIILDPFGGSGTTALVAEQEGRDCLLIELNEEYIEIQKKRTQQTSLLMYE